MKLVDILRQTPGGSPVPDGTDVTLTDAAAATIATLDTADGLFSYAANGNPHGRVDWTATHSGATRSGSSLVLPQWGPISGYEVVHALRALGDGVVAGHADELAVTATGTRQVSVAAGAAVVRGVPVVFYAAASPASAGSANASGADRLDNLVLEVIPPGNADEGKAVLKIVEGTAAEPTLTRTASLWQHKLAGLALANGGTSYTVTDARTFLLAAGSEREDAKDGIARAEAGGSVSSTSGADLSALNVALTLDAGVVYDVEARATVALYNGSAFETVTVSIAPYVDGPANAAPFLGHNKPTTLPVTNVATRNGVVGTGAAIQCGVLARTSNAAYPLQWSSGVLHVRATPRN